MIPRNFRPPGKPIAPNWTDRAFMDAQHYGYVTDGRRLLRIDRSRAFIMEVGTPATMATMEVLPSLTMYVRECIDGSQGRSKQMRIPDVTLWAIKSEEQWARLCAAE